MKTQFQSKQEKLSTEAFSIEITMYLEEKGVSVESEIEKAIDGIYNKSVPVGVREFISRRNGGSAPKTKKNKPVSSFAVGMNKQEDG